MATDRWAAGAGTTQQRGRLLRLVVRPSGGVSDLGQVYERMAYFTVHRHLLVNGDMRPGLCLCRDGALVLILTPYAARRTRVAGRVRQSRVELALPLGDAGRGNDHRTVACRTGSRGARGLCGRQASASFRAGGPVGHRATDIRFEQATAAVP